MKIVAIGGVPASGKTTLVRALMQRIPGERVDFKDGLIRGSKFSTPPAGRPSPWVIVLGVYDGVGPFEGTDKLSMSVQPKVEEFLQGCDDDLVVIFEGDRLFNQKFLSFCRARAGEDNFRPVVLGTTTENLASRHVERADTQTSTFLKGRQTKIQNILAAIPCTLFENNSVYDMALITDDILRWAGLGDCSVVVTRAQADEALAKSGEMPFKHLVRRFKTEHGLDFKEEDFNDKGRFSFGFVGPEESEARAFKITYTGPR